MRRGYVHVYTGNGKGKTTAAIGLAIRAAGAGLKVFIAQFVKNRRCSEHKALERFEDLITIKQYGMGFMLNRNPSDADIKAAQNGLQEISRIIRSKEYNIIILDEANIAVHYGLFPVEDLLRIIKTRPRSVEIVITGRYADKKIIDAADLATEMKVIKHYADRGVRARFGIEK